MLAGNLLILEQLCSKMYYCINPDALNDGF